LGVSNLENRPKLQNIYENLSGKAIGLRKKKEFFGKRSTIGLWRVGLNGEKL